MVYAVFGVASFFTIISLMKAAYDEGFQKGCRVATDGFIQASAQEAAKEGGATVRSRLQTLCTTCGKAVEPGTYCIFCYLPSTKA